MNPNTTPEGCSAGVPDAAHDFWRDHVAGHANHEQVTETTATKMISGGTRESLRSLAGGEWALALGETGAEEDRLYFNAGRAALYSR